MIVFPKHTGMLMAKNGSKLTCRLVEKAGVGLVMWNLCRRGVECHPTSQNSHEGDLWAKLPDGAMAQIEVKASSVTPIRMARLIMAARCRKNRRRTS